jgi:hypothetical protein
MFMIHLYTKSYASHSNISLYIAIKFEPKYKYRVSTMFYILKESVLTKIAYFLKSITA